MHADTLGAAAAADASRCLPRWRRLRQPAEFAAVYAAARANSLRTQSKWLAMTACWSPAPAAARLGLTVSKKMARRAIDRALVKRIAREAFRQRAAALEQTAAAARVRTDVSVRLRRAVPRPGAHERLSQSHWRRELRVDADALMASLLAQLQRIAVDA